MTTIADLLTLSRIPFARIVSMGGDIDGIRREAIEAGDLVLAARVTRAIARR